MMNRRVTASCVLEIGRGLVTDLMVTANGADAVVELYDGKSEQGTILLTLLAKNGYTESVSFKTYPFFHAGLYVKVNALTSLVNIGWREERNDGGRK